MSAPASSGFALAHARFGRAVTAIYACTAAIATALLVGTLLTDLSHQKEEMRERLSLETQVRAQYFARYLEQLSEELTRLGTRSEVNLLDSNLEPERGLLRLSQQGSPFFGVGVAILDADGVVLWSEPQTFMTNGRRLREEAWFRALTRTTHGQTFATPGSEFGPGVEIAVPIVRGGRFQGALLGAVDLSRSVALSRTSFLDAARVALASVSGELHPADGTLSRDPAWAELFRQRPPAPFVEERRLQGAPALVAAAPVNGTDFVLVSIANPQILYGPARDRLRTRLALGLALALIPVMLLIALLRRSLAVFQRAEESLVRDDRLRSLGEAVDLIAHEVKNSLNGIRVGLDLVLRGAREPRNERAVAGMRTEIERLSEFTTELLSFSKGVTPRPVTIELAEFVRKVSDLARENAEGHGVRLDVTPPVAPVPVFADPTLLHVAVANLVGNAVDFASRCETEPPRVAIGIEGGGMARVRVRDNGPGVDAFVKPRLFEPFVTGRPSGVGIGLAMSRRIARAHGGDLVLEESSGGASFLLTLPLPAA
jgi:two-component system C4-dicarboxylate transport sensor histidine kinase DctB